MRIKSRKRATNKLRPVCRNQDMQFEAAVMDLFGRTKADVGQVASNTSAIGARADGKHHWQRINQAVSRREIFTLSGDAQMAVNEQLKGRGQELETAIEGLISRQQGEAFAPMGSTIIIDAALAGEALQMTEYVHGQEFLISKQRLEIAQALLIQDGLIIVEGAD
jgi:hypothetical protein